MADVQVGRDTLTQGLDSQLDVQAMGAWSPPEHPKADGEKLSYNSLYPVLSLFLDCHCSPQRHVIAARATQWGAEVGEMS